MRFGLERMERLMHVLGDPHRRFRSIHVVGTNGKSSTARMIAAILERHGLRTGAYLSPHLRSFVERVEIRQQAIPPDRFAAAVQRVAAAAEEVDAGRPADDRVTQFEALTAIAYLQLADREVDVAVIEAGLGGRFDATSVISSDVQVVTNVDLEHTELLGSTHAEIAAEKLAVVPDRGRLVLGPWLHPDARRIADLTVARRGARLALAQHPRPELRLRGRFQRRNFALAEAAAAEFAGPLDPAAVLDAASTVRSPGRLEIVGGSPITVLDGAHNPHGMAALIEALPELLTQTPAGRAGVVAVVSILEDKDVKGMLKAMLPHCASIIVTSTTSSRARPAQQLALVVRELGGCVAAVEPDPVRALLQARRRAAPDGLVLATGSLSLVGDLLAALQSPTGPHGDRQGNGHSGLSPQAIEQAPPRA